MVEAGGYWESTLAGAPESIGLSSVGGRPGFDSVADRLSSALATRLDALAAAHSVERSDVLLAAFVLLLQRLSSQADIVLPRAGTDGLALPLRFELADDIDVAAFLRLVATRSQEAAHHAQAWHASGMPASDWQVLFSDGAPIAATGGLLLGMQVQQAGADGSVLVELHFANALLDGAGAERWLSYWRQLLDAMLDDPQARVAGLAMLTPAQLAEAVEAGNATAVAFEPVANVHHLFELQAARTPGALALVQDGRRLSYAELDAQANRLARQLRECGVGPDERVAIYVERGVEVVLGLLAVLKAGGAYVPLDPTYPADRLAYTLADSEPRVLLTMSGMENPAQDVLGELPPTLAVIDLHDDTAWRDLPAHALETEDKVGPDNLAYVLYTSGSTGKPKGVAMTHGPLVNLIQWQMREPGNDVPLRTLQFAALGFDVAFQETFATLASGGELHLIDQDTRLSAGRLFEFIVERRIERMFLPYFALQMLAEGLEGRLAALAPGERVRCDLREVITAGEQLRIEPKIVRFFEHLPGCRLHNHYGPTETHVVTALTLGEDPSTWPRLPSIGRPIANARVYVLDGQGRPQPPGVVGELYLAGPVVARGYLKRPDLSDERFLPDPFVGGAARMYRTGDLGRRLPDGEIEYLGRQDFQVKIRGFRVELGEIEAQVMAFPGVREAGVLAREDVPGLKRLVAYLSPQDSGAPVDLEQLRRHLVVHLPDYMVPVAYVQMDALPLSPNGKLDRGKLPAPGRGRPEWAGQYAAPRTPVETALCRIFADVLDLDDLGRDDNFFDLGGTSLLAIRVLEAARRERVGDVPPMALFRSPTPALLAAEMAAGGSTALDASRLSTRRGSDDEPIAIIAMAGRFPGAASVEALWDNLCAGRDSVARFSADQLDPGIPASLRNDPGYVPARGVFDDVDRFDAAFFGISPKEAELMDPQQRVFLELCWEAIERAGHVPDATTVPVGVFAGMYNASYYQRHVLSRPDLVEKLGAFQVMLGNEKDYIATRVAHKLNLTGPAVSVHTACSTSLVAIAQAIDSLRAGRCGMALAGGIAVTCPVNSGHLYQEGGMLSADGSTRSFDAEATGTVFSDGAAVVVLKRLSDAIADGNPVYAVVRGAAINNDGGGKASFTAPSSEGQAAVIAMAHADAGVEPRSIGYVETHGTATPMGDPIEIEGLTRAFRQGTDDTGFCVVGSVKSNLGHTLMAAGAAGVIKTAYALQQGCIPPTVHFRKANPVIDFASTPFRPSGELLPWPDVDGTPRRAGVSSFGVGGTNAHVVMEQPPTLQPTQQVDGPQLLVLSARTPAALAESVARLADHLDSGPDLNLADVAWTLAVGRKAFAHRIAVAADGSADAVAQLRSAELAAAAARARPAPSGEAVFLFPGQGCQYAGMGRELHAREPAFREAFDACAAVLDDELGLDLRALVFGDDGDALLPTAIMQPAIFSIEYSLARWWMAQGVVPVAMAGHSVGEFVAATLAGVFELPDALRLVARRGRLMQAQPSGAMLSVRMAHDALAAKLPDTLSLAAENAPGTCVVAGPHDAVAAFHSQLETDGVACRLLKTSHAFHSAMMDAVVPRFRSEVDALVRRAPTIPIVSTATGEWLGDEQATSADYWAQHLRLPVRFSAAIARLLERREHVLLEVGPRNTLATLARQQPLLQKQRISALASLADAPEREHAALVAALGQAWAAGLPLRPEALDRRERKARLRLPTYPFERKRYWVDVAAAGPQVDATQAHAPPALQVSSMDGQASSVVPVQQECDGIAQRLRALLKDVSGLDFDSADPQSNFFELGLDSLALTQVAQRIATVFGATITFRQLMESCSTLAAVEAALRDKVAAPAPTAVAGVTAAAPTPAAAAVPSAAPMANGDAVASLLDRQLQLMTQQLAALSAAGDEQGAVLEVLQQQQWLMSQQLSVAALLEPDGSDPPPPGPPGGTRAPQRSLAEPTGSVAAGTGVAAAAQTAEYAPAALADDQCGASASLIRVPTTEPQREIWLAARIDPSVALAFNQSISLTLHGALDVAALGDALHTVVARHDALRSTISTDGEWMHVHPEIAIELPLTDLSPLSGQARAEALAARRRAGAETPFLLDEGPLLRAELVRLSEDEHVLLLHAHHLVCDGWSWNVIVRELGTLYSRQCGQGEEDLPSALSYAAHARLLAQRPVLSVHPPDEAYWLSCFEDAAPVLDLPTDRPRAPSRDSAAGFAVRPLDAGLAEAVGRVASARGASVYACLLATFGTLLSRLAGQDEVVVGIPVAGQAGGTGPLVGHCVNMLPLRLAIDHATPFASLLRHARTRLLDAMDHQRCTFGSLLKKLRIERDPSRPPLVAAVFNVDQAGDAARDAFAGLSMELSVNPLLRDNFDFSINAVPSQDGIRLECQYASALFDAATVDAWLESFETLLRGIVQNPEQTLSELPLVGDAAFQGLQALQPPALPFDRECRMHEHFERRCDIEGARIAIRAGDETLDYAQLEARANQVAHLLRAQGVEHGALVGISLDRTARMPAAVLGVLKSGAAYVPLDPELPRERLAAIVADAGLALILTETANAQRLEGCGVQVLPLDGPDRALAAQPTTRIGRDGAAAGPESVAYVIYTSGSTGTPKGVRVPHRAVANLVASMQHWLRLGPDDVVAAVTPLSFDPSVVDLCLPLAAGAQLVLVDRDTAVNGDAFGRLLERTGATYLDATPSGWRVLLAAGWRAPAGFKAICGGEAMPADVAAALLAGDGEVWNMYGPTETTVTATGARLHAPAPGQSVDIHIGRPVENSRAWIVDRFGHLCPRGVPGELWIGGEGVSLGYLDRAALTAQHFVSDVFAPSTHHSGGVAPLLYRTGDRGRWRADGNLELTGRLDFQVKVRGYRIELAEIEVALAAQPGVAEAAVVVHQDGAGDAMLVAYVRAGEVTRVEERALAERLKRSLPAYMIPRHIIVLEAFPQTANGKLDRTRLPAPQRSEPAPPAVVHGDPDATARVASAMAAVLELPAFGHDEDFFAAGGHSLLASRLATRLEGEFGAAVNLRMLFDAPTPATLAAALETSASGSREGACDVPRQADQSAGPLSLMQQRLWVQEQLHPGSTNFMIPSAFRLHGPLDTAALDRAFADVVRRQPALRTWLHEDDEGVEQRVLDELEVTLLPAVDLSATAPGEREAELSRRIEPLIVEPLDTGLAPLFRVRLFRLSADEHVLYFQVHHAVWDGVSFRLFCEEMAQLYAGHATGSAPRLPPLQRSYVDFAAWHVAAADSAQMQAQMQHWLARLANGPEALALPEDLPRPAVATGRGGSEFVRIEAALAQRLRALAAGSSATLFMTLLAAYFLFLHRTTGQRDLVIGLPMRSQAAEQLQEVMGYFVNVLPMRLQLDPAWTFRELLARVREELLACFAHPDVPLERLVQALDLPRDPSRSPVYQALFSMDDSRDQQREWGALHCEDMVLPHYSALTDLSMWVDEDDDRLLLDLNYNADIISAHSAMFMAQRFGGLLATIAHTPDATVGAIDMLGPHDREALAAWNSTTAPLPAFASLPGLLCAQAASTPERVALRFGETAWRYRDLDARSSQLADALSARGVGKGALVGVCLERGPDLVVALLAVLKLGAGYVPLDPAYPQDRLRFMVDDAGLALVVSVQEAAAPLALPRPRLLLLDGDAAAIDAAPPAARAADPVGRDAPAYVIYTSGSTGKPKGVVVPHGAVLNFLASMREAPGLGADDRLLAVTTPSFDISVLELFLPLSVGAEIVLATREQAMDGDAIAALLADAQVTTLQATPATWHMLLEGDWTAPPGFKALCGGEPLSPELAARLLGRGVELWNLYGPTETTVWSTCTQVLPEGEGDPPGIHVGRPIANTTVWILDDGDRVCPVGVPGEICIGGAGVTLGYLGRPELTAEKFIPDHVAPHDPGTGLPPRLYRTGDLGRWRPDGVIEHLGRLDFQVKVRGHRIELGEIEAALDGDPAVLRSVVLAREDQPGDVRLVGYVVAAGELDERAQFERLRKLLPGYMVPQHLVVLEALPLLPNGKVDRRQLPPPASGDGSVAGQLTGASPQVAWLLDLCVELIGAPVRPDDNFFDAGGHSLLAVKLMNRVHRETGSRPNMLALATLTIEQVAAGLEPPATDPPAADEPGETLGLVDRVKDWFSRDRD